MKKATSTTGTPELPPSDPFLDEKEKISREIDRLLYEGKKRIERRQKALKLLLLGQSESGKSAMLKNFQITFAPKHFESERPIWRVIVQLNIIGSIKTILEALEEEYESGATGPADASSHLRLRELRRIRLAFSPLFFIEANLLKLLAPGCSDSRDIAMHAGNGWKTLVRKGPRAAAVSGDDRENCRLGLGIGENNDPTSVLAAQKHDIIAIWTNPSVQAILEKRRPRLQHSPGFFMNDIARITAPNYMPTDSDIIRARIRTIGIEEHYVTVEKGTDVNTEFFITDVGGTRNQRASWAPFFDDVQAIIFLAPLAFNQVLNEDPKINRLEDSFHLWKDICSNKLLINANLILFFNKRDVLAATLASGVLVKRFVPLYGDLPNDVPTVTKYFKEKFRIGHKKSADKRPFICHETSAIDVKSMAHLLLGVRESIVRQNLRHGEML
ncbi:heterotrimeric GTP-binding alpha subunit [Phlegmacium glaucopus]|nr:heterotrimeric GTP-binding alpha subunit [Phlegmacium glaucopus]